MHYGRNKVPVGLLNPRVDQLGNVVSRSDKSQTHLLTYGGRHKDGDIVNNASNHYSFLLWHFSVTVELVVAFVLFK